MAEIPQDPLSYIWYLLAQVAASIGDAVFNINALVTGLTTQVSQAVQYMINRVGSAIQALAGNLAATIVDIVDGVLYAVYQQVGPILEAVGAIVENVRTFFAGLLNQIQQVVIGLWNEIRAHIGAALEWISAVAQEVVAMVRALAAALIDTVVGWVKSASAQISNLITAAIKAVADLARSVVASVTQGVESLLGSAQGAVKRTIDLVEEGWKRLVTGSESLVKQIAGELAGVTEGFGDAADVVAEALASMTTEGISKLKESIESMGKPFTDLLGGETYDQMLGVLRELTAPTTIYTRTREMAFRAMENLTPTRGAAGAVWGLAMALLMLPRIWWGVMDANAAMVLQEYGSKYPWQVMTPADTAAAWRRGLMSTDEAVSTIRRHGYDATDAQRLVEVSLNAPPPVDVVGMWRRGIITEEQMFDGLRQNAIGPEWEEPYVVASEFIPPVQDLISMAVREAFSPEVRARFGQDQDFPPQFEQWARKQGVAPDWAKAYWAAHWRLPSVEQGFEMLHRGVITREDLNLLMRAADVMPFWRDALVQVAYHPYTRVDIRRLHRLGLLTDEELIRAHLDLGYDQTKAEKMAEFVKRLNAPAEEEEAGELSKVTRASILGFYADGLLTRPVALERLVGLGMTQETATLYLEQVDIDEEEAERKAEAALVVELALAGTITREAAEDRLRQAGLTATEVEKTMATLYRRLATKTKIPTRSEGETMLKAGVITREDYRSLLSTLGYSERWADAFLKLAEVKGGKG